MAETLNLVNPSDSLSCTYEISSFPDGQQSLKIIQKDTNTFDTIAGNSYGITIKSRLNSFRDLELIICATQALRGIGVKTIRLYIPYCLGGRSDRKFADGGINYIKNVIAPIINSQGYESVLIIDPHSDVLEACINNFIKQDNKGLVYWALRNGILSEEALKNRDLKSLLLVSPDAGALKKVYDVAEGLQYKQKIVIASKHRDLVTGKITHTNVPGFGVHDVGKDVVIVDDICDGGRTFIELAKAINEVRMLSSVSPIHGKNYLIVTHGIFSAGFDELSKYFEAIYTTNSIKDIEHPLVKQLNVF